MKLSWYVLQSKPRKEMVVWQQARAQALEAYYPHILVRPVNPRSSPIRPYFPGYLFVRLDLRAGNLPAIQSMPFTRGLVCFGGVPARVPDEAVSAIRQRLEAINRDGGAQLYNLQHGDTVQIRGGPFDGYEAIFDTRLSGDDRVRVLLKMLSDRHVPMELPVGRIEPRT